MGSRKSFLLQIGDKFLEDKECLTHFILWFSHHLSSIQFIWPREEWACVLDIPKWALQCVFVQKVLDRDIRLPYWDKVKHQEPEMCAYVLVVSARLRGYTRLEPRGGIADAPYLFKVRCCTCLHEHGDFLYLAVVSNFRTRFLQCQRCGSGGYITLLRDFGVPLYHGCPLDTTTEFQGEAPIACFGSIQFELFQCTLGRWQAICTERQDVGFFEDIVLGQYMIHEEMPGCVRFDRLYFERIYLDSVVEHPPLLTNF